MTTFFRAVRWTCWSSSGGWILMDALTPIHPTQPPPGLTNAQNETVVTSTGVFRIVDINNINQEENGGTASVNTAHHCGCSSVVDGVQTIHLEAQSAGGSGPGTQAGQGAG